MLVRLPDAIRESVIFDELTPWKGFDIGVSLLRPTEVRGEWRVHALGKLHTMANEPERQPCVCTDSDEWPLQERHPYLAFRPLVVRVEEREHTLRVFTSLFTNVW